MAAMSQATANRILAGMEPEQLAAMQVAVDRATDTAVLGLVDAFRLRKETQEATGGTLTVDDLWRILDALEIEAGRVDTVSAA
jgi:hypothetical protein